MPGGLFEVGESHHGGLPHRPSTPCVPPAASSPSTKLPRSPSRLDDQLRTPAVTPPLPLLELPAPGLTAVWPAFTVVPASDSLPTAAAAVSDAVELTLAELSAERSVRRLAGGCLSEGLACTLCALMSASAPIPASCAVTPSAASAVCSRCRRTSSASSAGSRLAGVARWSLEIAAMMVEISVRDSALPAAPLASTTEPAQICPVWGTRSITS